jgi:hypothetical protein
MRCDRSGPASSAITAAVIVDCLTPANKSCSSWQSGGFHKGPRAGTRLRSMPERSADCARTAYCGHLRRTRGRCCPSSRTTRFRRYAVARVLLADGPPGQALLDAEAPRWALPAGRLAVDSMVSAVRSLSEEDQVMFGPPRVARLVEGDLESTARGSFLLTDWLISVRAAPEANGMLGLGSSSWTHSWWPATADWHPILIEPLTFPLQAD